MEVNIDSNSGFCFGVVYAVEMAEYYLNKGELYCIGDIVHNSEEIKRLSKKGLKFISKEKLNTLRDTTVLIRAHGEEPSTYKVALENNLRLIDASCPVVLKLQNRVRNGNEKAVETNRQLVIYGQKEHAEVIGLQGQTKNKATVIENTKDIDLLDYNLPITLFTQTTKSTKGFLLIINSISEKYRENNKNPDDYLIINDTLCRQVSNREPQLKDFSQKNDVILFVAGKNSSNGKSLYQTCKSINSKTYFISSENEIEENWFKGSNSVGITGATSTPNWLIKNIAKSISLLEIN